MAVAALAWVNISASSYDAVWGTRLSVLLAGTGVSLDLREWVNSGLMTFFFLVFGLEARREFDLGELRERARLAGFPGRVGRGRAGAVMARVAVRESVTLAGRAGGRSGRGPPVRSWVGCSVPVIRAGILPSCWQLFGKSVRYSGSGAPGRRSPSRSGPETAWSGLRIDG